MYSWHARGVTLVQGSMVQLYLDTKADFTQWQAFQPDGTTASTALSSAAELAVVRYGPDHKSARLTGDSTAAGHLLRFAIPATDLTGYDELRLYVRGDRVADGSAGRPFYLELRLGSVGLPAAAPANPWRRLVPLTQPSSWELVRCSLADLPAQVRSGLSTVELHFIDATTSFAIIVDDLSAVRDEMVSDVEAALLARLHARLTLAGKAVPALMATGAGQVAEIGNDGQPDTYLTITCHQIQPWDLRQNAQRTRRDFVPQGGYALTPAIQHWMLTYRIDAVAPDRATESRLLDFVLRTLSASSELVVASYPLQISFLVVSPVERGQARPADPSAARAALFYQIIARQELGAAEVVRGANQVLLTMDYRSAQGG